MRFCGGVGESRDSVLEMAPKPANALRLSGRHLNRFHKSGQISERCVYGRLSEGLFTDLLLHLISEELWERALTLARDESFHKRAHFLSVNEPRNLVFLKRQCKSALTCLRSVSLTGSCGVRSLINAVSNIRMLGGKENRIRNTLVIPEGKLEG